jgi:hypothetical protein
MKKPKKRPIKSLTLTTVILTEKEEASFKDAITALQKVLKR